MNSTRRVSMNSTRRVSMNSTRRLDPSAFGVSAQANAQGRLLRRTLNATPSGLHNQSDFAPLQNRG